MKRIIICCDGTWNKPGNTDRGIPVKTNVLKLYEALSSVGQDGISQVKYYGQGVGTKYSLSDIFFGGITGSGIDRHIQDAYKFIMWNFEPGDDIYLFGFSRGAYTARSLIGLVRNCGIMLPQYLHLVDEAYSLYRDRNSITHPDSDLMVAFKKRYSQITRIKFIGVWDTVGSLGIPVKMLMWFNKEHQFHDVKLSSDVDYAYHAVALDEKRALFQPTLWELSHSVRREKVKQEIEQVWFPGTHSNVGGGYADAGLSDISLDWMIQKAQATNLAFKESYLRENIKPNPRAELRNSISGVFSLLSKRIREINKPIIGISEEDDTGVVTEYNVIRNERIHYSCIEREKLATKYTPKNLLSALNFKTPFYPDLSKWKEEWRSYLAPNLFNLYFDKKPDSEDQLKGVKVEPVTKHAENTLIKKSEDQPGK
ncbi:MAG: DUF2235 domain-containing protein [Chitinophagaceae bacterium]